MDTSKELDNYILEISNDSGLKEHVVRIVIDSQIDKLLCDLLANKSSKIFFGEITRTAKKNVKVKFSNLLIRLLKGEVDKDYLISRLQNM